MKRKERIQHWESSDIREDLIHCTYAVIFWAHCQLWWQHVIYRVAKNVRCRQIIAEKTAYVRNRFHKIRAAVAGVNKNVRLQVAPQIRSKRPI